MCHASCITFGAINLTKDDIAGKRVIELGACEVNGSLRPLLESYGPAEYVGVDIASGPGVDIVCPVEDIFDKFQPESFDVVVSTEMLEHVRDWRLAISNIKRLCKPGGIILLTTRSQGFIYHAHPYDFWRYQPEDMKKIFADCEIIKLQSDPQLTHAGVFIKARKPIGFQETDLADIELYSITEGKRVKEIAEATLKAFHRRYEKRQAIKKLYNRFYDFIKSLVS